MRKIFESWIALLLALTGLALSVKWYCSTSEKDEPLISIFSFGAALLTALVYRLFPEKKEAGTAQPMPAMQSKNVVSGSTITTGGDIHIGDKTETHLSGDITVNNEGATIDKQFNGGTFNNTTFN